MSDTKTPLVHVSLRLPAEVVAYFKEFPSYSREMRRVLEEHTRAVQDEDAAHIATDQQRWQDIIAEEERNA